MPSEPSFSYQWVSKPQKFPGQHILPYQRRDSSPQWKLIEILRDLAWRLTARKGVPRAITGIDKAKASQLLHNLEQASDELLDHSCSGGGQENNGIDIIVYDMTDVTKPIHLLRKDR